MFKNIFLGKKNNFFIQATGVDRYLTPLTLPSVIKLRSFINTTLSDILFYTSPVYCQVWKE